MVCARATARWSRVMACSRWERRGSSPCLLLELAAVSLLAQDGELTGEMGYGLRSPEEVMPTALGRWRWSSRRTLSVDPSEAHLLRSRIVQSRTARRLLQAPGLSAFLVSPRTSTPPSSEPAFTSPRSLVISSLAFRLRIAGSV